MILISDDCEWVATRKMFDAIKEGFKHYEDEFGSSHIKCLDGEIYNLMKKPEVKQ